MEMFKEKKKEEDPIVYTTGKSFNNPMAEKLAELKSKLKTVESSNPETETKKEKKEQEEQREGLKNKEFSENTEHLKKEKKEIKQEKTEQQKVIKKDYYRRRPKRDAIDKQIFEMGSELEKLRKQKNDEKTTPEQRKKIEEKITILEQGIEEARRRKKEIKARQKERWKKRRWEKRWEKTEKPRDKIEEIINKANSGKELTEEELLILRKFKTSEEQKQKEWQEFNKEPLIKEIKDLIEKKQKGAALTEEEQRRLEMMRLRADIIRRGGELSESEEKAIAELSQKEEAELKEKKLEDFKKALESARESYLQLEKEYQKIKKSDDKAGLIEIEQKWEEAQLAYKRAKTEYAKKFYIEKIKLLKEKHNLDENNPEFKKHLDNALKDCFLEIIESEGDKLAKARLEGMEPRKQTWFRKLMANYASLPTWKKIAYSTGIVTGLMAAGGALGLGGVFAYAAATPGAYAAQRAIRGLIGGKLGALTFGLIKTTGVRKIEEWRKNELEKLRDNFACEVKEKEGFDVEKLKLSEENIKLFSDVLDNYIQENENIIKEANRRHRNITRWAIAGGAVAGIGAGLLSGPFASEIIEELGIGKATGFTGAGKPAESALTPETKPGASFDNSANISKGEAELMEKEITELKTIPVSEKLITLEIGNRGPEGAIIDYFRENPEIAAEKFGCPSELIKDGIIQDIDKFDKWAGIKAHQLWLEDAKEALTKPETLAKLKELGYSPDIEGYSEMMRRIGKGFVEIDPKTGSINLADVEYLKARAVEDFAPKKPAGSALTPEGIEAGAPTEGQGIDVTNELIKEQDIIVEKQGQDVTNELIKGQGGQDVTSELIGAQTGGAGVSKTDVTQELLGAGKEGNFAEIVKRIFGQDIFSGEKATVLQRKDSVIVFKDAYKKGFDLLIDPNKKTIGVDGPMGWNWGSRGAILGFGERIPINELNADNIEAAKKFIIESAEEMTKAKPD